MKKVGNVITVKFGGVEFKRTPPGDETSLIYCPKCDCIVSVEFQCSEVGEKGFTKVDCCNCGYSRKEIRA